MTLKRAAFVAALTVVAAVAGWLLFVGWPGWMTRRVQPTTPPPAVVTPTVGKKIKAHLFYVAESGTKLKRVEQDVAYGESTVDQAKAIVNAQLGPAAAPLISAMPPGTALRALFVTPDGEAYVDFSREIVSAHPGGSLNELLTIYTVVHALMENLPVVTGVQVLVDGKEVDTLAGHVDLRRPLVKNPSWVE